MLSKQDPSFGSATPIVDCGADLPKGGTQLLWPVLAWRVLVPQARTRPLNLFQTAVVKLCRAGVLRIDQISERLGLDHDLVAFIVRQLQEQTHLDPRGKPSDRVLRLIAGDDEPPVYEATGHVFSDALGGRLWSVFWNGPLPFVAGKIGERDSYFIRGGMGQTEKRLPARPLWPDQAERVPVPTPRQILRASRRHARRRSLWQTRSVEQEPTSIEVPESARALELVELVVDAPEPLFVPTSLFVPSGAVGLDWRVSDPCGLGASSDLRAALVRLQREDRAGVRRVIDEHLSRANRVDPEDLTSTAAIVHGCARDRVRAELGDSAISCLPVEVGAGLITTQSRLLDARSLPTGARSSSLDDFFRSGYASLEQLFGWLIATFGEDARADGLVDDKQANRRHLEHLATRIGFVNESEDSAVVGLVLSVDLGNVQRALKDERRFLPDQLAALLLAASRDLGHPIHQLAAAWPGALTFLGRFRRMRDSSSHADSAPLTLDDANTAATDLFRLIRCVVPGASASASAAESIADGVMRWSVELKQKLRAQAAHQVICVFRGSFDDAEGITEVRGHLIDMQERVFEIERLRRGAPEQARDRLSAFAGAAANAAEAALALVAQEPWPPDLAEREISDRTTSNAIVLADAAREQGFALADDALPAGLAHVRPYLLRGSLKGGRGTLGARVLALVLGARDRPNHPIRAIARSYPEFLLAIDDVAKARGHGGATGLAIDGIDSVSEATYRIVREILSAID